MARLNLIDWHELGQRPFAGLARTRQQGDALIGEVQAWIGENYGVRSPVAAMAARSGLPERSFDRRFRKATGLSPLAYVHTLRLEEAKQQLEATRLPIEAVAAECGYEDAGYFSRLFTRRVGLTPANYRRRFGRLRDGLASPQSACDLPFQERLNPLLQDPHPFPAELLSNPPTCPHLGTTPPAAPPPAPTPRAPTPTPH